jgi:hypothetical protein
MSQSAVILQSVDLTYAPFLALSYQRHAGYADACGADYQIFTGMKDRTRHPSWNKVALLREALLDGYTTAVWLDADCLVVDQTVNIVAETAGPTPLLMARYANETWFGEPHYNAGVVVAHASDEALMALTWIWEHRHGTRLHHHPMWWDNNWFLDYAHEHPSHVGELPQRFNWMPRHATTRERPVILGLHGETNRLTRFQQAVQELSHAR